MAEANPAQKFAEKGAAQMKETSERFGAAAEQTTRTMEKTFASATQGLAAYNLKALEMARANSLAAFDCTQQLMSVKSPSEAIEILTSHARKQFEMLTEQTKELTSLGQKLTADATAPMAQGVSQVFNKVS